MGARSPSSLPCRIPRIGPDHPEAIESLRALGEVTGEAGDDTAARTLLREALERRERVHEESSPRTADVIHALATYTSDLEKKEALFRRALAIRRGALPADHPDIGLSLAGLADVAARREKFDEARDLYRQSMALLGQPATRRLPSTITVMNDYSGMLITMNDLDEAERLGREALPLAREVPGTRSATTVDLINSLASTLANKGRLVEAESAFREAYDGHVSLMGERHWRSGNAARNVGRTLALQQRYEEAIPWMDRAVEAFTAARSDGRAPAARELPCGLSRVGARGEGDHGRVPGCAGAGLALTGWREFSGMRLLENAGERHQRARNERVRGLRPIQDRALLDGAVNCDDRPKPAAG